MNKGKQTRCLKTRGVAITLTLFALSLVFGQMSDKPKALLVEIATGIGSLSREQWAALFVTFVASIMSWVLAVIGGILTGTIAGASVLDSERRLPVLRFAMYLDVVFHFAYVTPLVLTVSLFYAISMKYATDGLISYWIVPFVVIGVAALALGGYQIHKSIFDAVVDAKQSNRYLIDGLYTSSKNHGTFATFLCLVRRVHRFRDCEISRFCAAVVLAFDLAVVSVVIVETVIPGLYEYLFRQSGVAPAWLGGAGKQMLTASNTYEFRTIAGLLEAIFVFDLLVGNAIHNGLHKLWLHHYQEET